MRIPGNNNDHIALFQQERLHRAAQSGDMQEVEKWLAAKHRVNRFDSLGKTPLHYAVSGGHLAVVNRLIEAGANVNANDERVIGNTPLSDNIGEMSFDMAQRLIEAGADQQFAAGCKCQQSTPPPSGRTQMRARFSDC